MSKKESKLLEDTAPVEKSTPEEIAPEGTGQAKDTAPVLPAEDNAPVFPAEETVVYFGPSIPFGRLRTAMILKGSEEELMRFLEPELEKYPEVRHLVAPVEKLSEAMEKVGRRGTLLHKYYEDMLAKTRAERKG